MSEKQEKFFSAQSLFFSCAVLILCAALAILIMYAGKGKVTSSGSVQEDTTLYRELANKLKSVGLAKEALSQYEQYFTTAQLDKKTRANLTYTIGTLYLDEGNYEKALSWLYRVDMIDPDTPLKSEVGSKIVHCLESLGRFRAAEYALAARSGHKETKEEELKGNEVVAEVAGRKISVRELDETLDELPPWIKDQFKGKEKKLEFLKKYVADELFYLKAQKLELDKDSDLRKKTDQFMKQLMINKILEKEIKDKVTIEEDDLKNHFKANQDHYQEKAQAQIRVIKTGTEENVTTMLKELKKGKDFTTLAQEKSLDKESATRGGKWEGWVTQGKDDLGIGNIDEVSKAIFSTPQGEISSVVKAGDYYYIFKVEEKKPERMRNYEEVKEWVKNDYMNNKMALAYQNLVEQMLRSPEVKLYPQVITQEETASK